MHPLLKNRQRTIVSKRDDTFRDWRYATAIAYSPECPEATAIALDTGCDCTLISESLLEALWPSAEIREISPERVGGITASIWVHREVVVPVLLDGHLQDEQVTCQMDIVAKVIPKLSAGLLVGTDNLGPNQVTIRLATATAILEGCDNAILPIFVTNKPRRSSPQALYPTQEVKIPAGARMLVPVETRGKNTVLANDRDYLFEPKHAYLGLYNSVFDSQSQSVLVHNTGDKPCILQSKEKLGTASELDVRNAFHASTDAAELAFSDPQPAKPIVVSTANNSEVKLDSGITVAGSDNNAKRLTALTERYCKLWLDDGSPVDIPEDFWMEIPIREGERFPKRAKAFVSPPEDREVIDTTLDKLQDQGRLCYATGHTPSAYPVFVVWKETVKDGVPVRKGRVVVDIRNLNAISEADLYPVQQQEDLLRRIAGKKYLSVFDAASFFYQWRIKTKHRNRLAIVSHRGQEVFNVAVMGYINSIAYVARMMANILRGYEDFVAVYVDDIMVYSDSFDDHLAHLDKIFARLEEYNVTLSAAKTFLGFTEVTILGQKVSSLGLTTTRERTEALTSLKFPQTLKELEHYLGLTGWLRHFVPHYAAITEPLQKRKTLLLKESPSNKGSARKEYSKRTGLDLVSQAEQEAFDRLQSIFTQGLFLSHHDASRPLFIDIDASKQYGFGVMAFHADLSWLEKANDNYAIPPPRTLVKPILFLSRMLTPAEEKFWPTELELACMVWSLRKMKHLVEASKLTVLYTDHAANVSIAKQSTQSTAMGGATLRLTLGAIFIQSFKNLRVHHIPGKDNLVPDALSRLPSRPRLDGIASTDDPEGVALPDQAHAFMASRNLATQDNTDAAQPGSAQDEVSATYFLPQSRDPPKNSDSAHAISIADSVKDRLRDGYTKDKRLAKIVKQLKEQEELPANHRAALPYELDAEGLLWHKYHWLRLCIPFGMHREFFETAHTKAHLGFERSFARLEPFAIHRGARRLREYIAHCPTCLQNRTRRHAKHGDLQPILEPFIPFHTICIDIVLGLPDGVYDAMLTVTDKATKRVTYIPGRSNWTADDWGDALDVRLAEGDWGSPRKIICDRDPKWVAKLWRRIWTNRGTLLAYTTAWHAQADGQSEVTNQVAEIALRNYISYLSKPANWHMALPHLQAIINSSVSSATKTTPHRLMYGMNLPAANGPISDTRREALGHKAERYDAVQAVAEAIMAMTRHYNKKALPLFLKAGDKVMLRLHKGYNIPSTKLHPKVSPQYAGPFRIKRQVGRLAYELELPSNMQIHPVINVSHLDPAPKGNDPYNRSPQEPPPVFAEEGYESTPEYEVEKLIGKRIKKIGKRRRTQYLVRWAGYGPEWDDWYDVDDLGHCLDLVKDWEGVSSDEDLHRRLHPGRRRKVAPPPTRVALFGQTSEAEYEYHGTCQCAPHHFQ